MKFEEYLVSKGITEEQATEIVSGMPDEKFHLTSEEKLDERYEKLKTQKEQLDGDLANANKLVDDLKKSNKSNEDLQSQIDDYKTQLDNANSQREEERKQSVIELALTKQGALNNKATKALIDLDKVTVTDDGVEGLDEQLKTVKEENPYLFKSEETPEDKTKPQFSKPGNPSKTDPTHEDKLKTILGIKPKD